MNLELLLGVQYTHRGGQRFRYCCAMHILYSSSLILLDIYTVEVNQNCLFVSLSPSLYFLFPSLSLSLSLSFSIYFLFRFVPFCSKQLHCPPQCILYRTHPEAGLVRMQNVTRALQKHKQGCLQFLSGSKKLDLTREG